MRFDFQTWMIIALLVCGAIWLFDRLILVPRRRARVNGLTSADRAVDENELEQAQKMPLIVEYARTFFPIILVVLVLRAFIAEPFRIPSGSMMPTLLPGDFILVNKYTYGVRLPVTNYKMIDMGEPQRGDIAVFRFPKNLSLDYIKRIVGLPGDKIAYRDKQIFINGEPVPQEWLGRYTGPGKDLPTAGNSLHIEQLDDVRHKILLRNSQPAIDGQYTVPRGHYFVMGDNRDNSNDSRFWGFVPEENLIGEAIMIWMNWDPVHNTVRWDRIGSSIE